MSTDDPTDSTRRKYKAGVHLADQLNREFSSGRATRKACEVERRLAVCRKCDQFRGDSCAELELHGELPEIHIFLTRADQHCNRWSASHEQPVRLPATSTDESLHDRIHKQGVTRTRAERREVRRAGRRR